MDDRHGSETAGEPERGVARLDRCVARIVNRFAEAMELEDIRPIAARPELGRGPVPLVERRRDVPELAELVARQTGRARDHALSLACPTQPRVALPRFAGASLGDVALYVTLPEIEALTAPLPPQPRVLLGPGAMTMALALVATLAFGVFVVTH